MTLQKSEVKERANGGWKEGRPEGRKDGRRETTVRREVSPASVFNSNTKHTHTHTHIYTYTYKYIPTHIYPHVYIQGRERDPQ